MRDNADNDLRPSKQTKRAIKLYYYSRYNELWCYENSNIRNKFKTLCIQKECALFHHEEKSNKVDRGYRELQTVFILHGNQLEVNKQTSLGSNVLSYCIYSYNNDWNDNTGEGD